MADGIPRRVTVHTPLAPVQPDQLSFSSEIAFIRPEKQENFPELEFTEGKAYGVYDHQGKFLGVFGGDHSHAFEAALLDGYVPEWMQ